MDLLEVQTLFPPASCSSSDLTETVEFYLVARDRISLVSVRFVNCLSVILCDLDRSHLNRFKADVRSRSKVVVHQ